MTAYEKVKEWRKLNPDKVKEQTKRYRAKHPETAAKASKIFRERHLEDIRKRDREKARKRRATPEYKAAQKIRNLRYKTKKREEQEQLAGRPKPAVCEICATHDFRIVFDHCHKFGHFRGWICDRCNRVLGCVQDMPDLLRKMADYLEERGNL